MVKKSGIQATLLPYSDIKRDSDFEILLSHVADYDIDQLTGQADQLAFWINVYNIGAVKLITEHYPVKSIKTLGGFLQSVWNREVISVGGKMVSLGHIEHKILRQMDEERIHFAIVCASLSCPDLRQEAFQSDKIDLQLQEQMVSFLSNASKGVRIDEQANALYVSEIFQWFKQDFEGKGGVSDYISLALKQDFSTYKIFYVRYNWSLNDAPIPFLKTISNPWVSVPPPEASESGKISNHASISKRRNSPLNCH